MIELLAFYHYKVSHTRRKLITIEAVKAKAHINLKRTF